MITVIALTGKAGSGKTTVSTYLGEKKGYIRLAFADHLKKMLAIGLGVNPTNIYGNKKGEPNEELCGVTGRHAMQTLGTEWGRKLIHPDIWVKALERDMAFYIKQGKEKFIIDDVRFLNEAKMLDKHLVSGDWLVKTIRLKRGNSNSDQSVHISETEMDSIQEDYTIINDGSKENLFALIDNYINSL